MTEIHGGNLTAYPDYLDFSANINPLGMPESVRQAVLDSADDWSHYPDPACTRLVCAISEHEQFPEDQIVCGNGAADLIYRMVSAFRPQSAVVCAPTFSEYESALQSVGCKVTHYLLRETSGFRLQPDILEMLTQETDILFLCTPNNPTGLRIAPDLLRIIAEKCRSENILLICDECFLDFTDDAKAYSLRTCIIPNSIILKAFTKIYAIPGLRLGYACCGTPEIANRLRQSGQYWSVSVPAQAAGIEALRESAYVRRTVRYIADARKALSDQLRKCGLRVYPSDANFLLLKTDRRFAENMKQHRILVRSCANFNGLSDSHYRIAVRTERENAALIRAVKEVYGT